MRKVIVIQLLFILALVLPAHAEKGIINIRDTGPSSKQVVFIDLKEGLAVLTTPKNKIIFGKIKRYPSGQIKISF